MDDRTFTKMASSLRYLMRTFDEVLRETGSGDIAGLLPWADRWLEPQPGEEGAEPRTTHSTPREFPSELAERCVRAYSLAFTLADQAEENAYVQGLRSVSDEGQRHEESGSWEQAFALLQELGYDEERVLAELDQIAVEPVLTAHPTEAKRRTVLEHQRDLYRLLVELENSMWTQAERREIGRDLEATIERLWRTGEIYLEKPSLADERRVIVHFLRTIFPRVVEVSWRRLMSAWTAAGYDAASLGGSHHGPALTFGNWVGGDRDGHPFVTPEFTAETLIEFRRTALDLLDEHLEGLGAGMSLSENRQPTPQALAARVQELEAALGPTGVAACQRNPDEIWRQYVNLLRAALPTSGPARPGELTRASELEAALEDLGRWLREVGAARLAERDVDPVIRIVQTFGFHLARIDVRQNSAYHDEAIAQLAMVAGVEDASSYPTWSKERRRAFLDAELASRRPLVRPIDVVGEESKSMVGLHQVLADHIRSYGADGLGALIVSMTRSAEDLLAVYVLAREGGLLAYDEEGGYIPLEVVPLLETIDDLQRAPEIMDDYLSHPEVQRSLRAQARREGKEGLTQQVMVGYSDSGKDGGIVASMWSLNRCQDVLARLGRKHGVRIRFFHGRGGTIGRGAGPTHRFVRALPPGSLGPVLRVTEQGETIRQKYANPNTAAHHVELFQAGALSRRALDRTEPEDPPELRALMEELAEVSRATYVELLQSPGFVQFFERATPIDAIENSRIGSRPTRRKGGERKLENLRAIPWVFAWNQARFVLPGWYGLGTALESLDADKAELLLKAKNQARSWPPVHYLISNAATAFSTSSRDLMEQYAELAREVPEAEALFARIVDEHERTHRALEAIYGRSLDVARPNIHRVLRFRAEALEPIHRYQIQLLRKWRADDADDPTLIPKLLRTINAISSGLGATG